MTFKKIISVFLISIALLSLSACTPEDADNPPESSAETEAVAEEKRLVFIEDGKTEFTVIRSETAQGYYLDTAQCVAGKLKGEYSDDFKLAEDWLNPLEPDPATAYELLLFSTARPESEAAIADLPTAGYLIRVTDFKIVIVGTGISQCNAALNEFFYTLIPEYTEGGVTAFPVGLEINRKMADEKKIDVGAAIAEGKTLGANFEILFEYKGRDGFSTSQGVASDGKYAYVVMKKKEGSHEIDRIVKIDMANWEIVSESDELPLDHGNDMMYDPNKNCLIVVNMLNNIISVIDPETLTLTEQKQLPYGTWGVGYIDGAGQYAFLAYGSPSGLVITDGDFNSIRSSALADSTGYVGQGMDADAKYAYVPLSPNSGKPRNIIQIYDIATGEYLGIIPVATKMESESMFHVGGDYYIHFNSVGSKIAALEFYVRFE
jgi:hypothetical protein